MGIANSKYLLTYSLACWRLGSVRTPVAWRGYGLSPKVNIDAGARGVSAPFPAVEVKSCLNRPLARCKKARPEVGPTYWPSTFVVSLPGELREDCNVSMAASVGSDSVVKPYKAPSDEPNGC